MVVEIFVKINTDKAVQPSSPTHLGFDILLYQCQQLMAVVFSDILALGNWNLLMLFPNLFDLYLNIIVNIKIV